MPDVEIPDVRTSAIRHSLRRCWGLAPSRTDVEEAAPEVYKVLIVSVFVAERLLDNCWGEP